MPQLREHACQEYLDGFEQIGLREDTIPNLAEVNKRLGPRTGWNATPVSGFLPPDAFFEMLAARQFPTTTWLRSRDSLEYTPEPDIFHDVFGHVPMHAHPVFADFLQHYGKVCARLTDSARGTAKDKLERMGRLFWFTVEFGVIRQNGHIKLYGSGLISSHGESNYVIQGGQGAPRYAISISTRCSTSNSSSPRCRRCSMLSTPSIRFMKPLNRPNNASRSARARVEPARKIVSLR